MKITTTVTSFLFAILGATPGLAAPPTTVYAAGTAVFQSTDGGAHWTTISPSFGPIAALAIDPTNTQVIYAGVYNAVYKTTNGGTHWTEETNGISGSLSTVTALAIDPANPSTIYAGTGNFGNGVYKSTDAGVHWTAINNGLMTGTSPGASLDVHALAIDPIHTGTLYVTGDTGFFTSKTTNGGASWSPITGLTAGFGFAAAVNPVNTSTVYLAGPFGASESTNGGGTWTELLFPQLIASLAIDPTAPMTVYAGASGCVLSTPEVCANWVYKTTNGGANFTQEGSLPGTTSVNALAVDPANPATLYAGSNNGVYQSTNGGTTWSQVYATSGVHALVMQPNATQAAAFNLVEAVAQELIAGVENLKNTTLSCDILQGLLSEVKTLVQFDFLSSTQGQALTVQVQTAMQSIPCQ